MKYDSLVDIAAQMLSAMHTAAIASERSDAARGKSLTGGVLAVTYKIPRCVAEEAVRAALGRISERRCSGCGE